MRRVSLRTRMALIMGVLLALSALVIVLVIREVSTTKIENENYEEVIERQSQFDNAFLDIANRVTLSYLYLFDDPALLTEKFENSNFSKEQKETYFRSLLADSQIDQETFGDVVIYYQNEFFRGNYSGVPVSYPDVVFLQNTLNSDADTLYFAGVYGSALTDYFVFVRQINTMYPEFETFAIALFYVKASVIGEALSSLTNDSSEGFSLLVKSPSEILFGTQTGEVGIELNNALLDQLPLDTFSVRKIDGQKAILIKSQLSSTKQTYPALSFSIVSVLSYSVLFRDLDQLNTYILIIGIISLILVVFLASVLARQMTSPIRKLIQNLRTFGKTKTKTVVQATDDRDEIVELEKTYDEMIDQIVQLIETNTMEMENKRKLELYALQMQINPHFLYNTLDTIAWMAKLKKEPDIEKLVLALAKFFRISLHKGDKYIRIEEEFDLIKNFVEIEIIRFPNLFEVEYNLDSSLTDCMTLKLILQPIVENAIKHGFTGLDRIGHLWINAFPEGENNICFEVVDDGIGFLPSEDLFSEKRLLTGLGGYGLKNVDERIKLEYGREYGITVESEVNHGTKVRIRIKKS